MLAESGFNNIPVFLPEVAMDEHRQNAIRLTHGHPLPEVQFLQMEKIFPEKAMRYSKLPLAVVL
ncbi:hypothetical protein [Candidatus Nitrotoga sp. HW29]|uniref:hypothetical protein n=1 Tax=Candidatus Nitrotoga sp. HW29 TaxID=2886963 RepID=UPI001EF2FD7E|nr:hypothetical protein [Candidatus Nitrotoga sp. HW29]